MAEYDGTNGNDKISGTNQGDFVRGTTGKDSVNLGKGYDMIAYYDIDFGVDVVLQGNKPGGGKVTGGSGEVSTTFANLERIEGSRSSDSFVVKKGFTNTKDADLGFSDDRGDDRGSLRHFAVVGADGSDSFSDKSGVNGGLLQVNYDAEKFVHGDYGDLWGDEAGETGVWVNLSATAQTGGGRTIGAQSGRDTFGKADSYDKVQSFKLTDADDHFWGHATLDSFARGGAGDDTLIGGGGDDEFVGGAGADFMDGGAGHNLISYGQEWWEDYAREHPDLFPTAFQRAVVNLSTVARTVDGVDIGAQQALDTFGHTDTVLNIHAVYATGGDDILIGTDARGELLVGGPGDDHILGGGADDYLIGDRGDDILDGGAGDDDAVNYAAESYWTEDWDTSVTPPQSFQPNTPRAGVIVNIDSVSHTAGGITVLAGQARDSFGDTDTLIGIERVFASEFDDTVFGNSGANWLYGGFGKDVLSGNGGTDRFGFDSELHAKKNVDTITDFGSDDVIALHRPVFSNLGKGEALKAKRFHILDKADEDKAGIQFVKGKLFYNAKKGDDDGPILFAKIDPAAELTSADFVLL